MLLPSACGGSDELPPEPLPEKSFLMEISSVSATTFVLHVVPQKDAGNYFIGVTTRASFENMGGDPAEAARAFVEIENARSQVDWGVADGVIVHNGECRVDAGTYWNIKPKSEYAVIVFGVDAAGGVTTDPLCDYVTTPAVDASQNRIVVEATVDGVVTVTTTTDDPYFLDCIEVSRLSDIPDDKLAEFIIGSYGPRIESCIETGGVTRDFSRILELETDYYAVAFGYEAGVATTELVKTPFRTRPDELVPVDCTFQVEVKNITATGAFVQVVPSNDKATYFWNVFSADLVRSYRDGAGLAQMMTESLQAIADALSAQYGIEFTLEKAAQTVMVSGTDKFTYTNEFSPDTEYCVLAVGLDRKARQTTEVNVSDTFRTGSGGHVNPGDPMECRITVSNVSTDGVTVSIVPVDKQMTYFSLLVDLPTFENYYDSDEEFIQDDLDMMTEEASAMGMSLSEYLAEVLLQGDSSYDFPETFEPGGTYIAYAYGLNADGTVTTGMQKEYFTVPTDAPAARRQAGRSHADFFRSMLPAVVGRGR